MSLIKLFTSLIIYFLDTILQYPSKDEELA